MQQRAQTSLKPKCDQHLTYRNISKTLPSTLMQAYMKGSSRSGCSSTSLSLRKQTVIISRSISITTSIMFITIFLYGLNTHRVAKMPNSHRILPVDGATEQKAWERGYGECCKKLLLSLETRIVRVVCLP